MSPTIILIAGGGLALLLLVVGLIVSSRDERSLVDERLEYLEEDGYTAKDSKERSAVMTEWIGKQAGRYSWGQNISRSLARADLKLRVGEYLAVTLLLMIGGAAVGWYLAGGMSGSSILA